MTLQLRPYQVDAIAAIRAQFAAGHRATLAVLATGLGKAVIVADVARRAVAKGSRVLVLAHTTEILGQLQAKIVAAGCDAAIEQGPRTAGAAAVVVGSMQTLRGKRLASWPADAFDLVVIDEAHRSMCASYRQILAHFAKARVLGVTATPDRGDKQALREVFATVAYRYELRAAIADGWLAPIVARRIVVDAIDLGGVKANRADLDPEELARVMESAAAVQGVVAPLLEHAGDRPTLVFAASVAHAHAIAAAINASRPGAARAVDGGMRADDRAAAVGAYARGELQFLVNCDLLTEGYDAPRTACVAMCRPTKSRARAVQMIGRGTRLAPGKADCLVLDLTGRRGAHRLVGPADCLAGDDLDDEVRDEIEQLLGREPRDVAQAIDEAEAAAAARRAELARAAVVRYHAAEIDLFVGADDAAIVDRFREPATPDLLAALETLGCKKLPAELSRLEAQRLIARLQRRRHDGLCSLGQARALHKAGVADTRTLTATRATELILKLKAFGWKSWALRGEPEVPTRRSAPSNRRAA